MDGTQKRKFQKHVFPFLTIHDKNLEKPRPMVGEAAKAEFFFVMDEPHAKKLVVLTGDQVSKYTETVT